MGNFKTACKWLREGKKVTRPIWDSNSYWELGPDEMICYADGSHAKIHLEQFNATDFKIYKEEFCLADKECISVDEAYYWEEDVKQFIKELKQVIPEWIKPDGENKDYLHKKIDKLSGGM